MEGLPSTTSPYSPVELAALFNQEVRFGWTARVGMESIIVESSVVNPLLHSLVEERLAEWRNPVIDDYVASGEVASTRSHSVPVNYNGEDLSSVAAKLNVPVTVLIDGHTKTLWRVAMLGFAPGFGYLVVEDSPVDWWDSLPRLATPRSRVPAGAVGVAVGMTAVYPQSMPGGWNLLGTTTLNLFDATNLESPALLASGDLVRFYDEEQK